MKPFVSNHICLFLLLWLVSPVWADNGVNDYEAYINRYYRLAQEQQKLHKIPAYITLAQGLLESAAGKSILAVEARNHFGVKCHDWEGDAVRYKGDCYRMYEDVEESYHDHSMFLLRSRYASLFKLSMTDYKGWAGGLKKCGYAEDPEYDKKLISIIERYDLLQFSVDNDRDESMMADEELKRDIFTWWGLLYIIADEGDTYNRIACDLGFAASDLAKYNDDSSKRILQAGDIVYLEPKKRKADKGCDVHTIAAGETFRSVSQLYGIDMKRLARRNKMRYNDSLSVGTVIVLR